MPNDQHSTQGRRPHYHRGRRGNDRRGPDRRTPPPPNEQGSGSHVDVEQIMHDIRSRIARRHGIDLSAQQIQELAARRLEAILEPRNVKPALMEQMRRAAAEPLVAPPAQSPAPEPILNESALYESHRGFLRTLRRWLNPLLKLFFNPVPIIDALNTQVKRSSAAAARETELYTRQAEWNALHYEILQRLITESARATIEMQSLSMRLESLAAKIDFNERRVRGLEHTGHQPRPAAPRPADAVQGEAAAREVPRTSSESVVIPAPSADGGAAETSRRRRRRRRGRRSGVPMESPAAAQLPSGAPIDPDVDADSDIGLDVDEAEAGNGEPQSKGEPAFAELAGGGDATSDHAAALEPAHAFSLLQPAERHPSTDTPSTDTSRPDEPGPRSYATPAPVPTQPTPPPDEPVPDAPVDHTDPGPPER